MGIDTLFERIDHWNRVAEGRRRLLGLDERMLHDLAITRADAVREARRRFWDDTPYPRDPRA